MSTGQGKKPGIIRRVFGGLMKLINGLRLLLVNLLFLFVLLFIVSMINSEIPAIPDKSALVLNPQGALVDQLSYIDPLVNLLGDSGQYEQETLLQDVIDAIHMAAADERITSIVMRLDGLSYGGISKCRKSLKPCRSFGNREKKSMQWGISIPRTSIGWLPRPMKFT